MLEFLRRLKAASVIAGAWALATGGFALLFVLFLAATTPALPSLEDMVLLPLWFAAGGFVLGLLFSLSLILGVRDTRLPRWKAALLGFLSGPIVVTLSYLGFGRAFDESFLVGSAVLGALIAALGVLTVSLTGVSEESSVPLNQEALPSPNPLTDLVDHDVSQSEPVHAES